MLETFIITLYKLLLLFLLLIKILKKELKGKKCRWGTNKTHRRFFKFHKIFKQVGVDLRRDFLSYFNKVQSVNEKLLSYYIL
jgi:hypothetical protein